MANTLSGEKTKYFNTRGEEVFLQPDKLVRDGGSKKLPFDPVDTKLANNIVDKVKNDYEQSLVPTRMSLFTCKKYVFLIKKTFPPPPHPKIGKTQHNAL